MLVHLHTSAHAARRRYHTCFPLTSSHHRPIFTLSLSLSLCSWDAEEIFALSGRPINHQKLTQPRNPGMIKPLRKRLCDAVHSSDVAAKQWRLTFTPSIRISYLVKIYIYINGSRPLFMNPLRKTHTVGHFPNDASLLLAKHKKIHKCNNSLKIPKKENTSQIYANMQR